MEEKELRRYYHLKVEIDDLKQRIDEFGDGVKSQQFNSDKVSSSHTHKSIQETKIELVAMYNEKRISAIEENLKIERYLDNIDDPEMRTIMRYRHLDLKTWEEIDKLTHNGKDYSKKKYYKYRKENK